MKVTYYPGCSLEGSARDYALSIEGVCRALGLELEELEDWSCCGATAAHSINHRVSVELPARNLAMAEAKGMDMVVPCPLCFNRLKGAEKALLQDEAGEYSASFQGRIGIHDLANFMAQPEILKRITESAKRRLKGLNAVCYYGCMASRPPRVTDSREYENPTSMDRILKAIGVEVKPWSYKTECCGASHAVARRDMVYKMVGRLYDKALEAGANCVVVSCQMCQANLDLYQDQISEEMGKSYYLPVLYFTELIGMALGIKQARDWVGKHFVRPYHLFGSVGLVDRRPGSRIME